MATAVASQLAGPQLRLYLDPRACREVGVLCLVERRPERRPERRLGADDPDPLAAAFLACLRAARDEMAPAPASAGA